MNYEFFREQSELFGEVPLSDACDILEFLFECAKELDRMANNSHGDEDLDYKERSVAFLKKAADLTRFVLDSDIVSGDSDDFHNFAMVLSRNNMTNIVLEVLEKGLKNNPTSVDLLADYLQAVVNGANAKPDRAAEIFTILKVTSEPWNWRAYKFSIDYLIWLRNKSSDVEHLNKQAEMLIDEFKHKNPDEALVYVCESDFVKESDPKRAKQILVEANERFGDKKLAQPRLRLADIYVREGDFESAASVVEKCIIDALDPQPSISKAYVYLLSALCKAAAFLKKYPNSILDSSDTESTKRDEAKSILRDYRDMYIAEGYQKTNLVKGLRDSMSIICEKVGLNIEDFEPEK